MSKNAKVWTALVTVYVIWGSTYLAIAYAGETIPPLFAVSTRFITAGTLMAVIVRSRGGSLRIPRRAFVSCVIIGCLLPGANAVLFFAERNVPTGLASLIIASVPLWLAVLRIAGRERMPWQVLAGGLIMFPFSVFTVHHFSPSTASIVGWIYLVTFGSIVGYTAYVWLLANAPLGLISTYAYVNPVVAITLGVLFRGEHLTWRLLIGASIVVFAVATVVRREPPTATPLEEGVR